MTEKELLLTALLNCKRSDLYTGGVSLDDKKEEILSSMLIRRKQGEPIQYITGFTEFMGLHFKVDNRALIPRPETEILVEQTVQLIENHFSGKDIGILDLCTGSGNIAISLAKSLENVKITASDISDRALELAKENAVINNAQGKIGFLESNLFDKLSRDRLFDIIVCNPPYLKSDELEQSPIELSFEPRIALYAGKKGILFYSEIIKQAPRFIKKDGYLIFEIGFNQLRQIKKISDASKKFVLEKVIKDYNNIDRVIFLRKVN
ncbi:MAG: peptide chain release factor N(5)-glutamine methyltransferase [Candidatus Omnitrophica bacterium]|nr:peptide chain release factor N(5)-glutamine methyltransferase [Candidatus Omnitrophota bacterium]HOX53879.1 peptide chain release factor N(5)-glutamine methyltransferase [Candidatus Omnitrophota bacterium]